MKLIIHIHLLLRFSDSLFGVGDVISKHNQVIKREGEVWFGKIGSPISLVHIDKFNAQCEDGISTFLYLVKGNRRKSTAYKAKVVKMSRNAPDEEETQKIPNYYYEYDIDKQINFWVKVLEIKPIEISELKKVKVASSVLPIMETLYKSSSGHFIVKEI